MSPTFPRVIVIVLDSVGIGELPDAGAYGDEGSNTLGNIARQVPLKVPALRSLGLGQLVSLGRPDACRCSRRIRPDGGGVAGEGLGDRPLGDDGHRARSPVSDVSKRVSARPDRGIRAPDRPRDARQRRGLRHRDHRSPRPRARAHRQADRLHVGRQRVSDCRARRRDPDRGAVPNLRDRLRSRRPRTGRRPRHRPPLRRSAAVRSRERRTVTITRSSRLARRCSIS